MTNAELIQKIRNEIERRIENLGISDEAILVSGELSELLSFLDALEKSVKPINQDELEMELRKEIAYFAINGGSGDDTPTIGDIARHFSEWGYLRAAEKYDEIEYNRQREEESVPKDLEKAAEEYRETKIANGHFFKIKGTKPLCYLDDLIPVFIAGAEWGAENLKK